MQNVSTMKTTRRQFGQGMMEYIIIVALIAVAAIGVYSTFGKTVRNQTAGMALEIAGKDGAPQTAKAATAAALSGTRAEETKGMGAYDKSNDHN